MIQYAQPAPDFTLPSSDGGAVRLADLRGEDIVLVFYCYAWGNI